MRIRHILFALSGLLLLAGLARADDKPAAAKPEVKAQTKCPVTGEDIDKDAYVDYQGKRIYFCCNMMGCDKKFLAKADEMVKKMQAEGVTLATAPAAKAAAVKPLGNTVCPVSGDEIDPEISVVYEGQKVNLCCSKCVKKFEKDPAKFMAALKAPAAKMDGMKHADKDDDHEQNEKE